jgi:hypothetical protein
MLYSFLNPYNYEYFEEFALYILDLEGEKRGRGNINWDWL